MRLIFNPFSRGRDAFAEVEKRSKYRFGHREEERSNRAHAAADRGPLVAFCPRQHDDFAWAGPPHNPENLYVCLHCSAYASEGMIKDMGYDFGTCPDYIMKDLMDEVLRTQKTYTSYPGSANGR